MSKYYRSITNATIHPIITQEDQENASLQAHTTVHETYTDGDGHTQWQSQTEFIVCPMLYSYGADNKDGCPVDNEQYLWSKMSSYYRALLLPQCFIIFS